MTTRRLFVFVYLPGQVTAVPAGRFDHDDASGVGRFAYGRRYLDRRDALPVDPVALALGANPMPVATNGGLYGSFRDASPDWWGRLVISSGLRCPPEALSEVDYLVHANATRVGNLDFRSSLDAPEPLLAPPAFHDVEDLMIAAEQLEAGLPVDERQRLVLEQGSSLGGARPKCTLQLDGDLWLAKLPSRKDRISLPRLEYATLKLAERCGLNVPSIRLETIGGRDVFLSRRFDRDAAPHGWVRRGYISALSLAQWDEKDREQWSYRLIAERIRKYAVHPAVDLHELFRRMAFNIFVRNTDDHPRNHGFIIEPGGVALSPLFDVEPSLARAGVSSEFFLSMSIGEMGRIAAVENLLSSSAYFNLKPAEADDLIRDMRAGVVNQWPDVFGDAGFDQDTLDTLAPTFDRAYR